jgi:thioredoxin-like negative regulator of GroEL
MLTPILEKVTNDPLLRTGSGKALDLVTVDTDEEFALAQEYKVRAMPTVIAFTDGKPVDMFVGALNEPSLLAFLHKI